MPCITVAKHRLATERHELTLDGLGRWTQIVLPTDGRPADIRRISRDQAGEYLQVYGPQSALDQHFTGLTVHQWPALPAPEVSVIVLPYQPDLSEAIALDGEVIPFRKQVAADSDEGAEVIAACQAIADEISDAEIAATVEPEPKPARKPRAPKAPAEKPARTRRAKAA